ncbi:unnamed protein product [Schistosoma spindalis]|nr:unnamed protein product [Schistosoma spindale]
MRTSNGESIPLKLLIDNESSNIMHRLNIQIRGQAVVALDGKLKRQDTNLASSTLIKDYRKKENMSIIVQYMIRIRAVTVFAGRDVQIEIPIILCHSRQQQEIIKAEEASDLLIEEFKRPTAKQHQTTKQTEKIDCY